MGEPLPKKLYVLSLDGGGAKGFYTLGALKEIEALTGLKLCEQFDLVFGTSTGAIIATMVGLGYTVDDMLAQYREHVVKITGRWLSSRKSAALKSMSITQVRDIGNLRRQHLPSAHWSTRNTVGPGSLPGLVALGRPKCAKLILYCP